MDQFQSKLTQSTQSEGDSKAHAIFHLEIMTKYITKTHRRNFSRIAAPISTKLGTKHSLLGEENLRCCYCLPFKKGLALHSNKLESSSPKGLDEIGHVNLEKRIRANGQAIVKPLFSFPRR